MSPLNRRLLLVRIILISSASCSQADRGQEQQEGQRIDITDQVAVNKTSAKLDARRWQLPIPARRQWENGHGYCGEVSIQSIGLYYGAWNSQHLIRQISGGETLLGVNATEALDALHFTSEEWHSHGQELPQFKPFMLWLKNHLAQSMPVIFGTYLNDQNDPDYDHIVTVVGLHAHDPDPRVFDPRDAVIFNSNFEQVPVTIGFDKLSGSREACRDNRWENGCVPEGVDYGIAVTGIRDKDHATRPVRMVVDSWDEPNISLGHEKKHMQAKVVATDLTPGQHYALLRYNDYRRVPTSGNARMFLHSGYERRTDFVATGAEWFFSDPQAFASDSSIYYRCVPVGHHAP